MTTLQTLSAPREVARVLEFNALLAAYINWDSIAKQARELGAHFEARYGDRGECTVIMFWDYPE